MHTALSLSRRHTLHTVHAALIFENTIDTLARHRQHNLFEAAGSPFAGRSDSDVPAAALAIFHIHLAQVAGKEGSLVATGTSADFNYCILSILRLGRYELKLYLLFKLRQGFYSCVELFFGHLAHFRVVFLCEYQMSLIDIFGELTVGTGKLYESFKVFVFLGEPDVSLHICDYVGVGNQCAYLFKSGLNAIEALQQGIFCHIC